MKQNRSAEPEPTIRTVLPAAWITGAIFPHFGQHRDLWSFQPEAAEKPRQHQPEVQQRKLSGFSNVFDEVDG